MKPLFKKLFLLLVFQMAAIFLFAQIVRIGGGAAINLTHLINDNTIYANATYTSQSNHFYPGGGVFITCNVKPLKGKLSPLFGLDVGYNYMRYGQYYDIIHPVGLVGEQIRKQTWFDKSSHNFSTNFKVGLDYRNAFFLTGIGIEKPTKGLVNYSVAIDGGQRQFNSYNLKQTGTNNFKTTIYWLWESGYNLNLKKNIVLSPFLHYSLLLTPLDRTETYYFPVDGRIGQAAIGISVMYSLKLKSKTK